MESKKRIYVGLLAGSLLFALALIGSIWYLLINRDIIISQIILVIMVALAIIIFGILGIGILSIIIMIIRSEAIPSLENITYLANDLLFPLTLFTGKLVGIKKEKILRSYIEVNNYLTKTKDLYIPSNKIMILLPHCLQNSECSIKITNDINNCKSCGKCKIGELKELAEEFNAVIKVASGGTLARKYILETRPRGVIAVACERDLSMGIHDIGTIPVLGVLNIRPNGPCYNTDVEVSDVYEALQTMSKGGF
ncbi:MAG TPA: DUF116 domain-containing protein [Syntrophomonadaceae bacterium]|nr:DUF116 domain-containing protein [Syntrophomonadaceae bacterium]